MKNIGLKWRRGWDSELPAPLILCKLLISQETQYPRIALLCAFVTPRRNWALFPALILTGCSSDRTVPMTAYELLAGVCVFLIAFLAYVLHQYGTAHREMMRLRSEARRVVDLASLTPEQLDEMAEAQQREIDRVSRQAVSEVGR